MRNLPTVIASTVVRSAHQGESHGGVYMVDLQDGRVEQVIDYDAPSISWEGRGGPRGLRGIAFHGDEILLAASDEVFVYGSDLEYRRSIRNPYLGHCHEIFRSGETLYLTATARDSVLEYDLGTGRFVRGYNLWFEGPTRVFNMAGYRRNWNPLAPLPRFRVFDPEDEGEGPQAWSNTCHLNNVHVEDGALFASGTRCAHLLNVRETGLKSHARIPYGTHNARPFLGGLLFNDTRDDRVVHRPAGGVPVAMPVRRYDDGELGNTGLPQDHARQGFARGLCVLDDGVVAGGSSPSTVSVYDLHSGEVLASVNLTMDVRNTIHGLEVWPF